VLQARSTISGLQSPIGSVRKLNEAQFLQSRLICPRHRLWFILSKQDPGLSMIFLKKIPAPVGATVGLPVGTCVGAEEGAGVGVNVGPGDGAMVGVAVGAAVGPSTAGAGSWLALSLSEGGGGSVRGS